MLGALDKLFFVLHAALIAFVLVGWAWRCTRPLHLVATAVVAFCWLGLGAYYGLGYCPLTDWHLQVRQAMGREDPYSSYVQLLASAVFGVSLDRVAADRLGGGLFVLMLAAAAGAWGRECWRCCGTEPGAAPDPAN